MGGDGFLIEAKHDLIDIGSNHGSFAVRASQIVGKGGFVLAMEPNPTLSSLVQDSLALNHLSPFAVEACCLSEQQGVMNLIVPRHGSGQGSLFEGYARHSEHDYCFEVKTTTFPLFLEPYQAHLQGDVLLKMDIEGYEWKALMVEGAQPLLQSMKPVLILEINPSALAHADADAEAIRSFLKASGYVSWSPCRLPLSAQPIDMLALDKLDNIVIFPAS